MEAFNTQCWKYGQVKNSYFKNPHSPSVVKNEAELVLVKHNFSICFISPLFKATYKNNKNFVSKIFKRNRSGKTYAEEVPRVYGCVNTKIQDDFNLSPKTSPVDYADMLLSITKIMQGKNKFCPFRYRLSEKLQRHHCQEQWQIVCLSGL